MPGFAPNAATTGQVRSFHSTRQQEIVPLLAAGAVVFMIGRYSYKALQRMDIEWEDYQWELQQYERSRLKQSAEASLPTTIGVDLGSIYLKLAHSHSHDPQPQLVVTSQGDRYRFSGMITSDDDTVVTGRPALEKFYYRASSSSTTSDGAEGAVVVPYELLTSTTTIGTDDAARVAQKVVVPAVKEAMDHVALAAKQSPSSSSPSESDSSDDQSPLIRTVLTLPPKLYNDHYDTIFDNYFLLQEGNNQGNTTVTIPDPVAAVWGAQTMGLLPTPNSKAAAPVILVVDVGGTATTLSLVQHDVVLTSSTINRLGGETFVQQLVDRIVTEASSSSSSASGIQDDAMSLVLIQQQARDSVMELVQKSQTKVHIPFLFMGRNPDDPHLDMTVSRVALEQAFEDSVRDAIIPELEADNDNAVLSSAMPAPTAA